jgi:hypothetical protein
MTGMQKKAQYATVHWLRPGFHRTQIARYKSEKTADRTSFTRFRPLQTSGQWDGVDPIAVARGGSSPQ